jgi:hypothetical protein
MIKVKYTVEKVGGGDKRREWRAILVTSILQRTCGKCAYSTEHPKYNTSLL